MELEDLKTSRAALNERFKWLVRRGQAVDFMVKKYRLLDRRTSDVHARRESTFVVVTNHELQVLNSFGFPCVLGYALVSPGRHD